MSISSDRLKALFDNSGLSYQELEKLTGVSKSSLQRYASGVTAKIPFEVIEKISNAFNVSQKYLTGWDEQKESSPDKVELTEGERAFIKLLRRLPLEERAVVLDKILSELDD